jgi:site-specific recombinase XerC
LYKRNGRGPWVARWFDFNGKRREVSTRTTDRAAAERILARRLADVALRRDGILDSRADRYAEAECRALTEHVADWKAAMTAKGVTTKQIAMLVMRVKTLKNAIGADRLSELAASAVQLAIGELHAKGKSLQTCQHYLRAVKQFARWLRRDGRTRDDALAHLTGYNAAADRRRERRALDAEELRLLIDAAEGSPAWRRMLGPERAMLYRVASGTGFRRSELRSLMPASFRLDDDPPAIAIEARASKRRRSDVQPIRADLADLLQPWLADKPPDRPVFASMPEKTGLMLRADLRRARAR